VADKRVSADEVVGELRSGMTIASAAGLTPQTHVAGAALCRSDLGNLTLVSYGGPDVGLLCAPEGDAGGVRLRDLDSVPSTRTGAPRAKRAASP